MHPQEYFDKIKELYLAFKEKAEIRELKYVAQISMSEDDKLPKYAVQFSNISTRLSPATFIGETPEDVLKRVEEFVEKADYDMIEMKYHEAQAYHCIETAKHHEKCIEEIKNRMDSEKETESK